MMFGMPYFFKEIDEFGPTAFNNFSLLFWVIGMPASFKKLITAESLV